MNDNLHRGICEFPSCKNFKRNKGWQNGKRRWGNFCDYHHKKRYNINTLKEENIENEKCERCGWNKGPCDRHRINNQIGYYKSNVIVLCPNCHRLVTLNIITLKIEDYKQIPRDTESLHTPSYSPLNVGFKKDITLKKLL